MDDLQRAAGLLHRLLGAGAAGVEAGVALLVVDAQDVRGPSSARRSPAARPAIDLVLADVGDRPDLLVEVGRRS